MPTPSVHGWFELCIPERFRRGMRATLRGGAAVPQIDGPGR